MVLFKRGGKHRTRRGSVEQLRYYGSNCDVKYSVHVIVSFNCMWETVTMSGGLAGQYGMPFGR